MVKTGYKSSKVLGTEQKTNIYLKTLIYVRLLYLSRICVPDVLAGKMYKII